MTSGEGAEEFLENISGVTENYIEEHEESAELFSVLTYVLGVMSMIGMWANYKQKSFSNVVSMAVLVFALVVIYFGRETGTTGGEIRHTEIRSDFKAPSTKNNAKAEEEL
ncbi:hypothetical protein GCM10023183_02040 [Nibribacter koreensis]|uniref:Uncharacterized protein n=2 Tax=Nibribacter koreensis TaxID=1084519 RepID=A0ABP8F5Z9_9BACT